MEDARSRERGYDLFQDRDTRIYQRITGIKILGCWIRQRDTEGHNQLTCHICDLEDRSGKQYCQSRGRMLFQS